MIKKAPANWNKIRNRDTNAATRKRQSNANDFSMEIADIILREVMPYLKCQRIDFSCKRAAKYLNDKGIPARRGGKWTTTQVSRVFERLKPRVKSVKP
jgi:hypothetical protein